MRSTFKLEVVRQIVLSISLCLLVEMVKSNHFCKGYIPLLVSIVLESSLVILNCF